MAPPKTCSAPIWPPGAGVENVCEILMMESKKSSRETQIQSLKLQNVTVQGPKLQTHKKPQTPPIPLLISTQVYERRLTRW